MAAKITPTTMPSRSPMVTSEAIKSRATAPPLSLKLRAGS
jgi:hypothetical protein